MTTERQQFAAQHDRQPRRLAWLWLSLVLVVTSLGSSAFAQAPEHTVKAAYIYNFARFVTWPEARGNFVIGVLGRNPFGKTLEKIAAKRTVHGRPISVRYFASLADYAACDLLFVTGEADEALIAAVLRQTDGRPVLVVGETEGFCERGGPVNFSKTSQGTVGIEINLDAMQQRKLRVDAKLLKLAKIVSSTDG